MYQIRWTIQYLITKLWHLDSCHIYQEIRRNYRDFPRELKKPRKKVLPLILDGNQLLSTAAKSLVSPSSYQPASHYSCLNRSCTRETHTIGRK